MSQQKPAKPYDGFPLYAHRNGQWAKKIKKHTRFFGIWADWQSALARFERDRDALFTGREPQPEQLTVEQGMVAFLASKQSLRLSGEITKRTYDEYFATCTLVSDTLGSSTPIQSLTPADFDRLRTKMAERAGPSRLSKLISIVRGAFGYLVNEDVQLIERPVRFGPNFRRPKAHIIRQAKAAGGKKLFTNDELQTLLAKANATMKAMILLGINCGLGNTDLGRLTHEHLDLAGGWLNYPRPKTGIDRRAKLWQDTVAAIKRIPKRSAKDKGNDGFVFITQLGRPWMQGTDNPVGAEFTKLLRACHLRRKGLSFYALRHTFQTVGETSRDFPAVSAIMGHVPASGDMAAVYREGIDDSRLRSVASHVHRWLRKGISGRRKRAS